jgi:hypothetical protein
VTSLDPGRQADTDVEPLRPDASVPELLGELARQTGTLFRQELELAKVETRQEVQRAGKAAGMFAGAGVAGWLALLLLSLALAWLLDQGLNTALSFAIVGVLWAIVAAVLAARARRNAKAMTPPLPNTTATLKEDVEWAKHQKS